MGRDFLYRGSPSLHLPLGTQWQDKQQERGEWAIRIARPVRGLQRGEALGPSLGKGRPPETDPEPFCWEVRNRWTCRCSSPVPMRSPSSHLCSPGSAEAWFAMPALWITRRESAAAPSVPKKEKHRSPDKDPSRTGHPTPPAWLAPSLRPFPAF